MMKFGKQKQNWFVINIIVMFLFTSCMPPASDIILTFEDSTDYKVPYPDFNDIDFCYDQNNMEFSITDTRSDKIWDSSLTDEYYGKPVLNKLLQKSKAQLFTMTYCDEDGFVNAIRNNDEGAVVTISESDDLSLHCSFNEIGIEFSLNFELIGNTLQVTIPGESVKESKNQIITIELLPFLGSSIDSENGYIFFPDGSGTLYDFKEEMPGIRYPYKQKVFGEGISDLQEYIDDSSTGIKWIMVPIFGVKHGESAFIGTVTRGEADTTLCFAPSGYIFSASRVYPIFNYRYSYTTESVTDEEVVIFENERYSGDFQIQYTFLDEDNANYSGMARAYRRFLLNNEMLNSSTVHPSVALDLLISIKKDMLLWDEKVVLSEFSDASNILNELNNEGLSNVILTLMGWQSEGYNSYPAHFPVNKNAGGDDDLHDLISAADKSDSYILLKDNFFEADKGQKGYSMRNDTVFNIGNEIITNLDKNKFLLDYRSAFSFLENKWLKYVNRFDPDGINIDILGRLLYGNNMKNNTIRYSNAVVVGNSFVKSASANLDIVSVSGGNEYILQYADMLSSIPESSSGDFTFDRDIPFFHIVAHGYIPYTPEIPGNISDNFENTILTWADYGYVPYFSISHSDTSKLKDTYSEGVFVSKFEEWKDRILELSLKFSDELKYVADVPIYSREELGDGVFITSYENEIEVIVNYTNSDYTYNGKTVHSMSYVVIDNEQKGVRE